MAILTAKFELDPPHTIVVECEDVDDYSYSLSEDEYGVSVKFIGMDGSPKSGWVNSDIYRQLVDKIEIIVSKEVGEIPEVPVNEAGGRDYTDVSEYFSEKKDEYSPLAQKTYARLIKYIKYVLKQPFMDSSAIEKDQLLNPSWSDSNGNVYGCVSVIMQASVTPVMDEENLGSITLKPSHQEDVNTALNTDKKVELYQEILSDAQTAIFSADLRRGVFEMALVCELSSKRKYFDDAGVAGLAFDYFEDKAKIRITVLELVSTVAEEVFGDSFKTSYPDDYENIDYLFRCRNKIAHKGKVAFRDKNGSWVYPDLSLVKSWFKSVENLIDWLNSK